MGKQFFWGGYFWQNPSPFPTEIRWIIPKLEQSEVQYTCVGSCICRLTGLASLHTYRHALLLLHGCGNRWSEYMSTRMWPCVYGSMCIYGSMWGQWGHVYLWEYVRTMRLCVSMGVCEDNDVASPCHLVTQKNTAVQPNVQWYDHQHSWFGNAIDTLCIISCKLHHYLINTCRLWSDRWNVSTILSCFSIKYLNLYITYHKPQQNAVVLDNNQT